MFAGSDPKDYYTTFKKIRPLQRLRNLLKMLVLKMRRRREDSDQANIVDVGIESVDQFEESGSSIGRSLEVLDSTDLSGTWKLWCYPGFKDEYDLYLRRLGQNNLVRAVALSLVGVTTEATDQKDSGRALWIQGTNPRGVWTRTLYTDKVVEIETADKESVEAEAWWEGNVHHSWLRGVSKYGGGDFESRRYLEDANTLACESVFHPRNRDEKEVASVVWKFTRM